jgi:hypothetical protein
MVLKGFKFSLRFFYRRFIAISVDCLVVVDRHMKSCKILAFLFDFQVLLIQKLNRGLIFLSLQN